MIDIPGMRLEDLSDAQMNASVACSVAVGTLYCFLGYRTLRFVLGVTGFFLAGSVAALLVGWMSAGHLISMAAGMLIGGVCGAMALFFLYKTGVFFLGLIGGLLVAYNFLQGRPEQWIPAAIIGLGVAGGLVALLIERPVVMIATSAIGGWLLVSGLLFFLMASGWLDDYTATLEGEFGRPIVLAIWVAVAGLGAFTQFATRSKPAKA